MTGSKEWLIRVRDEEYTSLSFEQRQSFLSERAIYPDEHQTLWDSDETYRKIYSAYSKAKKSLDKYKFDKRHP